MHCAHGFDIPKVIVLLFRLRRILQTTMDFADDISCSLSRHIARRSAQPVPMCEEATVNKSPVLES